MIPTNSIGAALANSCETFATKTALMHKTDGQYRRISYRSLRDSVIMLAGELLRMGVKSGDRVALISDSRPEWPYIDFAALSIGAVLVPIYTSLSAPQVQYILKDSGAKILFAQNEAQAAKAIELKSKGDLESIWVFDAAESGSLGDGNFRELAEIGSQMSPVIKSRVQEHMKQIDRKDLATIIYTSGTTGQPKGVMLTHGNLLSNMEGVLEVLKIKPSDTFLSLLPLAHVFERLGGHYLPLCSGSTVAYAESPATVARNLLEIKPTVMLAVPRLYEMMRTRILDAVSKSPKLRQKMFYWALAVGQQSLRAGSYRKPALILKRSVADRLVYTKLRARTGGRIRIMVSGGAALSPEVGEFFRAVGVPLIEGYGLTETSPVLCANPLEDVRIGTVGPPLPGVDIRIDPEGEILAKGPNVMQGYYHLPKDTKAAFNKKGFFKTGDIGHFDERGYLVITGRKKEILVTSKGKNIAPAPIENHLKTSQYINEIMIIGDDHHYLTAVVIPNRELFTEEGIWKDEEREVAIENPLIVDKIRLEIRELSADLEDFEQIKKFTVLSREFSIESEELTPTLKVRRDIVMEHYHDLIEGMYKKQS